MQKLVLFGTGTGCSRIKKILNYEKVKIVAYVDNDKTKQGKYLDEIRIIAPEELLTYSFDYIVIASQYYKDIIKNLEGLGISNNLVIPFYEYIDDIKLAYYSKYSFNKLCNEFEMIRNNDIELFVTGLSYAEFGIMPDAFKVKAVNLGMSSQDLFYDYECAKKIISNNQKIKYAILGLSYFSFEYDLSKSIFNIRCPLIYRRIYNDDHNYEASKDKRKCLVDMMIQSEFSLDSVVKAYSQEKMKDLLSINSVEEFISSIDFFVLDYGKKFSDLDVLEREKAGKNSALQDSNKNFPLTVKESIMIEPTESESKETIDQFIAAMKEAASLAQSSPEVFKGMPGTTPVTRPDEVKAAKDLNTNYFKLN